MTKEIYISGEAQYAKPWVEDDKFGGYRINVANLQDDQVEALKASGRAPLKEFNPEKGRHEWGYYLPLESKYPIRVIDGQRKVIDKPFIIPNGSKIMVKIKVVPISEAYLHQAKNGNTHKYYPQVLQIVELAEMPDREEGGFDGFAEGGVSVEDIPEGLTLKVEELKDAPEAEGDSPFKDLEDPSDSAPGFEMVDSEVA